ncbi:TniQ family protein [Streptomyces sp. NPDC051162]|uniref:TniQ family protein n=1 Tax=Streptomyces sp. NPDC051162 TaxID=3154747 RepID=UPI003448F048
MDRRTDSPVGSPAAGEALDSWLEAYGRRLAVTGGQFARFINPSCGDPRSMVRMLTDTERGALSRRTGLTPAALDAMTLKRFDGVVVSIDPVDRTIARPPAWRHSGAHSRFCPACLDEDGGRWQLSWRLPWTFACLRHQLLLHDRCVACGQAPPPSTPFRGVSSSPKLCLHTTGTGRQFRCSHDLSDTPAQALPRGGMVLASQRAVDQEILAVGPLADGTARARAQELYALARQGLGGLHHAATAPGVVGEILDECGGSRPAPAERFETNDAHSAAVGTALARIATDPDHPAGEEVFAWMMATVTTRTRRSDYATRKIADWLPAGPRVVARMLKTADGELGLSARLRHRTATPTPSWPDLSDDEVHRRAEHLPAMLWPSWTYGLLPAGSHTRIAGFRRACASLALLPGSTWGYLPAASLLNNTSPGSNRRALDAALESTGTDALAVLLPALAGALDAHGSPINYHRRRTLFTPDTVSFDHSAYQALCRRNGWPLNTPVWINHLRWHMTRELLGADPGAASRPPAWHPRLHYGLDPDLWQFLRDQAAANLGAHGIDEPITWEPPPSWALGLILPGPETLDRNRLTTLADEGHSAPELAGLLGIDEVHLLLALESFDTTGPPNRQTSPARGRRVPQQGLLSPSQLQALYVEQRLSQSKIAKLAGCSTSTVRRALDDSNIPIRQAPPGPKFSISHVWLEEEYRHKGRSSSDIAHQLGITRSHVLRLVRKWDIPVHPAGQWTNAFAPLDLDMSPAMRAASRTKNCPQRLRHLIVAARHPTLQSAADELEVGWKTLSYQLQSTEQAIGFTIITTGRGRPLTVTDNGRDFLNEAERLLSLLPQPPSSTATSLRAAGGGWGT